MFVDHSTSPAKFHWWPKRSSQTALFFMLWASMIFSGLGAINATWWEEWPAQQHLGWLERACLFLYNSKFQNVSKAKGTTLRPIGQKNKSKKYSDLLFIIINLPPYSFGLLFTTLITALLIKNRLAGRLVALSIMLTTYKYKGSVIASRS